MIFFTWGGLTYNSWLFELRQGSRHFQSSRPSTFCTLWLESFPTQNNNRKKKKNPKCETVYASHSANKLRLTITSIFCCGSWNPWTVSWRSTERGHTKKENKISTLDYDQLQIKVKSTSQVLHILAADMKISRRSRRLFGRKSDSF